MGLAVAEPWFELHRFGDDITLIREPHVLGAAFANMWHVRGRDRDLLLDSGMGVMSLRRHVAALSERAVVCVASHTHFDHIGGHHEFEQRAVHESEAGLLGSADPEGTLLAAYRDSAFDAIPYPGFDPSSYAIVGAPPTRLLRDRDVLDLGNRHLEVMHLPGHSPGSIALWEAATRTLISGDVITEGTLLDDLYHSDASDYVASLERIRSLPVDIVHPGHYDSFGRARFVELAEDYIAGKREPRCPGRPAGAEPAGSAGGALNSGSGLPR